MRRRLVDWLCRRLCDLGGLVWHLTETRFYWVNCTIERESIRRAQARFKDRFLRYLIAELNGGINRGRTYRRRMPIEGIRWIFDCGRMLIVGYEVTNVKGVKAIWPMIRWRTKSYHAGVMVLPILPDGQILALKVFRHGAGRELIEPIAGGVEEDETLEHAALRELNEECAPIWSDGTPRLIRLGQIQQLPSLVHADVPCYAVYIDDVSKEWQPPGTEPIRERIKLAPHDVITGDWCSAALVYCVSRAQSSGLL